MFESARDWVNNNSSLATILMVVFLIGSVVLLISQRRGGGGAPVAEVWYFDTVTKEIFADEKGPVPPIRRSNGNPAVRAYLFSCSDCTEANRFVGYYEKFSDDKKVQIEELGGAKALQHFAPDEVGDEDRLYSADGEKWVGADTPEGKAIRMLAIKKCTEGVKTCVP